MMNVYLVNNMIKLKDTTGHDWTKAYYLEAVFNHVFNEQYEYGCKVDLDLMQQLEIDIANLIKSLEVQIYESIPPKLLWKVTGGTAIKMNTANGAYSKRFLSFAEKAELSLDQVAGDVTPVEFEMLNLESPKQRNECLLKMGWVPLEFNYKETVDGRPLYDETGNKVILSAKLTEESVTCLPTGQLMLRYLVYSHKLKLVKGLRKLVRPDGTIGAGGISCGTNCFTIDTLINTQRGVVKFSDLEVTDEVVTHEGVLKPVVEIFNNGTKPVLKIVTEKGLSIRVTENHPILIDGNWKVASEVVEGDNVLVYSSVERWALIKDSRYSISSWGRVRSETDDKLLRLQVGDSGHLNVTLETSPRNTYRVHRLVAQYFLEGFDPSLHILHKNGMAFDNRVENLKIGNDKDNMVDTLLHGRLTTGRRRLSEDQITYIKNSSKTGADLAKELNISRGMICCIRRGSRYKTYEFKAPKVDFFADKVSTITSEGLQPTFGFEVRDHHSHITNGIVTHNTARAVHRGVVNIPRVGDDFGTELRSLFIAREGKVILGADLSALENRLAGHFTWDFDNGEYAKRLMEEDPHTNTVNLFSNIGLPIDRNTAKACNYGLGYGCRPEKLQAILKCTLPLAKQAFDLWWADRQVMLKLQEQLLSALDGRGQLVSKFRLAEGAYILGIDGRKLFVRSTHSLVNSLIQNAGSLINKFITSYIYAQIEKRSLDAHFILQFHDEVQIELVESDIPAMRELIIDATNACNKYYNLRVPMLLDVKVGKNWANTH